MKNYSLDGVQAILAYPFKVPGWQSKFATGAVLFFVSYFIPILPGIVLTGYFAKIMRDIIVDGSEPTLPEWDNWGNLFALGARVFGATLVYMLPVIVLMVVGCVLMLAPAFLTPFIAASDSNDALVGLIGFEIFGMFSGMLMFGIGFLLFIPLSFILPPVTAHVVAKDSFTAAFRIKEWWAIARANLWGFVTAIIIISGIYVVLILIFQALYFTLILCLLAFIFLSVFTLYITVVSAVAIAEAYRKGVENLAATVAG